MEQQYHNHKRITPLYHYVLLLMILVFLGIAVFLFYKAVQQQTGRLIAAEVLLLSFILILLAWFTRRFALIVQDRAIRAEENLRFFALTGQLFPKELRLKQIIALRFASDAELPALVKKAVSENLSSAQIKMAIGQWKADCHRV